MRVLKKTACQYTRKNTKGQALLDPGKTEYTTRRRRQHQCNCTLAPGGAPPVLIRFRLLVATRRAFA